MAGLLVREPASTLLPVPDGLRSLPSSWKRAPLISMAIQVPAGIYRLKLHIAGIRGQVIVLAWCRSPRNSPDSTFRMKWNKGQTVRRDWKFEGKCWNI